MSSTPTVFKKIVVAVDGSEDSLRALDVALTLVASDDAEVVLAHVQQKLAAKGGPDVHPDEDQIQADIRRRADELGAKGVRSRVEMASAIAGSPADEIVKIAEHSDADLLVVGSRGHGPLRGLLAGSVTQRLLHEAHIPVLAVPPLS